MTYKLSIKRFVNERKIKSKKLDRNIIEEIFLVFYKF